MLIAASAALAAAPAARAATAPHTGAPATAQVVVADPAASPSPTEPGIGLGPGAPTAAPTAPSPVTTTDPGTGGSSDPSWYDIPGQIQKAIDDWFGSLVAAALTPMLDLLGSTLLGTPDVTAMPRVESLWTQMAVLANAFYILLVLAGAVIVMTHGTVQSRNSAKEVVPRLFVGMIAGNASIALLALMIHLSDALASAILGGTIDPATAGRALGNLLGGGSVGNGIFLVLLDLGAQVMLIAILLTYIVRVAVTVVLAVAAPLALSLHALPQTEHLARLWWRAITGVFLIQLGQSLVFVVALDVMLDPTAAVSIFGLPDWQCPGGHAGVPGPVLDPDQDPVVGVALRLRRRVLQAHAPGQDGGRVQDARRARDEARSGRDPGEEGQSAEPAAPERRRTQQGRAALRWWPAPRCSARRRLGRGDLHRDPGPPRPARARRDRPRPPGPAARLKRPGRPGTAPGRRARRGR